jgi:hypothetical protein
MNVTQSTSEQAFAKALAAENAGDNAKAEMWLKLAVKREAENTNIIPTERAVA